MLTIAPITHRRQQPAKHTMNKHLMRLLSRLVAEPGDTHEWHLKKSIGVLTAITGMLAQLGYGFLFLFYEERATATLLFTGAGLFLPAIIHFCIRRHNYYAHGNYWLALTVIIVFSGTVLLGGIANSGYVVIWVMTVPLMVLIAHKPENWPWWFAAVFIGFLGVGFSQPLLRTRNNLPADLLNGMVITNLSGFFALMLLTLNHHITQNRKLSFLIQEEHDKADTLLLNILPKEIAALLKNGNQVIADHFDEVSILFADVVNFTSISTKMTPQDLVAMLNEVFSHIDLLVEKYGLEKIKTIGDCYMVASGVPNPRPDHAIALTHLALDIQNYINGQLFQGQKLTMRIGINSGPVVAGVIGRKKFIYDLWGDAVNTASRMESHGSAGCIQVTAQTRALILHDFLCEPQDAIEIKGKGLMPVWYVMASHKKDAP